MKAFSVRLNRTIRRQTDPCHTLFWSSWQINARSDKSGLSWPLLQARQQVREILSRIYSQSSQWCWRFFLLLLWLRCRLLKRKKRHFSVEPNISLNYLLSRVNMNDVGELDSVLETNKLEIETLNKELASTDRRRRGKKKLESSQKYFLWQWNLWGFLCLHRYTKH